MPAPALSVHMAYAYSSRHGYRARAYVGESFRPWHSIVVAIGDSREEAEQEALGHIRNMHVRDGVAMPAEVVNHGRKAAAIVDNLLF